MGVIKMAFMLVFYTLVAALILMVVPGIPPHDKFEAYTLRPSRKLEGKLSPNDVLDRAELVIDGDFTGPESVALRGDDVFTGIHGGDIIRVDIKGKWKKIVNLGGPCDDSWSDPCARPLGLRFNNQGKLLVADCYNGIFEVDVDAGTSKQLLSTTTPLSDGVPVHLADDLDVDKDGVIYFSDASQVGNIENVIHAALGDPTGRLVKFDPKTKKTEILINNLHFANGVQLSSKEDYLVVCETVRSRVWKYHLKGPKKGTKEIFIEGLPGMPDNIRSNGKGGFYISLVVVDTPEHPVLLAQVGPIPAIRKLVVRSQYGLLKAIEFVDTYAPNPAAKWLHRYFSHLGPFGDPLNGPRKVVIVDVDETGNISGSLQNKNSMIGYISEIGLGAKYTYFGSPYDNKFWRIKTEYLS